MKHKHADLIKAWADGAIIQHKNSGVWYDSVNNNPNWAWDYEYRIKPSPKEFTFWFYFYGGDSLPVVYSERNKSNHLGAEEYKKTITLTEDDQI